MRRSTVDHTESKSLGFTMIELLVVMSIIAMLLAVLLPGISRAREQSRSGVCRSNIRQIALANDLYSQESGGMYCPGARNYVIAPDPLDPNLHRWHGERDSTGSPFDPSRGPLSDYLGPDGTIRNCPTFPADQIAETSDAFEIGNGGFGYNNAYVGVQSVGIGPEDYKVVTDQSGAYASKIRRPARCIMFTDSAFANKGIIEYSFCEPRFHPGFGTRADPSIHFRHNKTANVAWCDGHVSGETRTFTWSSGFYRGDPDRLDIGWFGRADDNRLFDTW